MEADLEKCMDDLMENEELTGAICANSSGLTLSQRGFIDDSVAAAARDLSVLAKALEPESAEIPTIILKNGDTRLIISREGTLTVAMREQGTQ